jgi:hypothetical protein
MQFVPLLKNVGAVQEKDGLVGARVQGELHINHYYFYSDKKE